MFCLYCGKSLPDDAVFCTYCGKKQGVKAEDSASLNSGGPSIHFVPAKCPSCGAVLSVDPSKKTASCEHCGSAFIIDRAIRNYQVKMDGDLNVDKAVINVSGPSVENLLKRAGDLEEGREFERALQYYDQVLDIDAANEEAKAGIQRIDRHKIFMTVSGTWGFGGKKAVLTLKRDLIIIDCPTKKTNNHFEIPLRSAKIIGSSGLYFYHVTLRTQKEDIPLSFLNLNGRFACSILQDAQKGNYPEKYTFS